MTMDHPVPGFTSTSLSCTFSLILIRLRKKARTG